MQLSFLNKFSLKTQVFIIINGFISCSIVIVLWASYNLSVQIVILLTLLIILLGVLISRFVYSSYTHRLKNAASFITQQIDGNFDKTFESHPSNEFAELTDSLNQLSEAVQALIDEKISNENLAMMGEFAAFIIHDLKNPISGIHLLAEGLNKKMSSKDNLKKYSNEILLASQRLDDFIKKTLDITKPARLHTQPIQINDLIESILNDFNLSGIEIEKVFDNSIPEFIGDHQLLYRALSNIINNAIESIELEGKIKIVTQFDSEIIVTVIDNGKGIDSNQLQTIFRPFYSSKGKGHGLGLAMAKKTIAMHQGKIEVDSKIGIGSTFKITLPKSKKHYNIVV